MYVYYIQTTHVCTFISLFSESFSKLIRMALRVSSIVQKFKNLKIKKKLLSNGVVKFPYEYVSMCVCMTTPYTM